MKPDLTLPILWQEAARLAEVENSFAEPRLYGVTDGKAVGTYLEQKFTNYLTTLYIVSPGNSSVRWNCRRHLSGEVMSYGVVQE